MPDITDSMLGFVLNGYFKQWYGHALLGIFTFDLLGGLIITWVISAFLRQLVKYPGLPQYLRTYYPSVSPDRDSAAGKPRALRWWSRFRLWTFSVLIGILSHVGFDLISHDTNLLFYPWSEHARWFPGWWYTTWFDIRVLPMFGQSYAVGVFSVIWCILTLIGIFLFLQFLLPKHEN